jgi:hypothetical protein
MPDDPGARRGQSRLIVASHAGRAQLDLLERRRFGQKLNGVAVIPLKNEVAVLLRCSARSGSYGHEGD